jgi:hypothetical protein
VLGLQNIRRYVDLGFVVHPCCPPDHKCQSPGKIPFDPYEGKHMAGWQKHEQFTAAQWAEWLDCEPEINVGFLCGSPSSLLCIDIDNDEGMELIGQLDIPWRDTWQYRTGRGLRALFRHRGHGPSGLITRNGVSVEVLGDGRQSVLPPSVHPTGAEYRWIDGSSPRDCLLSSRTDWTEHLGRDTGGLDGEINSDATDWAAILGSPPQAGERNVFLTRLAGHLLSDGKMDPREAQWWLALYNQHVLPTPISCGELQSIVGSVGRCERRTQDSGVREIRQIMVDYGLSFDDAKAKWLMMMGD